MGLSEIHLVSSGDELRTQTYIEEGSVRHHGRKTAMDKPGERPGKKPIPPAP